MKPKKVSMRFLVFQYLILHKGNWPIIEKATGVSVSWISRFCAGEYANPGISNIEKISEYMEVKK